MSGAVVRYWNISNITKTNTTLVDLMVETSKLTNYMPGTLFLLALTIIIFIILKMKGLPNTHAFVACCFVQATLSLMLYPIGLISGLYLVISLILLPISGLILYIVG